MKHPYHVKGHTVKGYAVKAHMVKAHFQKRQWIKKHHVAGHWVGKPYVTKKTIKIHHTPTKKSLGLGDDLNMCALSAAGVVAGVNRRDLAELYRWLSPADDGLTIPEAMLNVGLTPVEAQSVTPGTILGLPDHAVVVEKVTPAGCLVVTWGELRFLPWEFIDANGEEAWLAA